MPNSLHADVAAQYVKSLVTHVNPKSGVSLDIANRYPVFRDRIYLSSLFEYLVTRGHIDQVIFQDLFKTITDKALNNEVSFSDHIKSHLSKAILDTLNIESSFSKEFIKGYVDSFDIEDRFTQNFLKTYGDGLILLDQSQLLLSKGLSSEILLEDVLSTVWVGHRTLNTDYVIVSDALDKQPTKLFQNSTTFADAFSRIPIKGLGDVLSFTESQQQNFVKHLEDSLIIQDVFSFIADRILEFVVDSYHHTDSLLIIPSKELEDIFVLLDTINVQYGKGLSHSLSLDDSNITKQLNSSYTDAYYSTDQLDKSAMKILSIDFFNLTDSGYLTTQSYADPTYFLENYVGEQRFF